MDRPEMRSHGAGEGLPVILLRVATTIVTSKTCQALGVDEAFEIRVVVAAEAVVEVANL
jgi:hypothetical protein